ncbi:CDP-diacylglycerol--serine O-phosphatidyltransferase [Candidatus Babela massiliensis]|uniref:CDP-diacylglycerol--serine O-phosphatidyltransferase n=1 Tax=Candidatus Babela massiliensis TaxID=673862 RepID=V6DJI5_9BACT|nr:CDP-diacylglycerol--serine O-phosphatidyltransferase [Candidatus Babela massiliensis]CDK31038.1 Phosphatidylserine synthase [Candidatus Babela massiliensis]
MLVRLRAIKNIKSNRNRYRRSVPCLFTFLNAIFGFLSILKSFEGNYRLSALFIILAALMDMLDGKIARALNSSSGFGMELDSLSDAISFCLAPTILLYCWLPKNNLMFITLSILSFYLCSGISRLAKFNTKTMPKTKNYEFIGLPTTAAALLIVTFVLSCNNLLLNTMLKKFFILGLVSIISLLMISNLKFSSIKNFKIFKVYTLFIFLLGIILTYYFGYILLFLGFLLYVVYNIKKNILILKKS